VVVHDTTGGSHSEAPARVTPFQGVTQVADTLKVPFTVKPSPFNKIQHPSHLLP
jgi:hypothetical protein